MPQMRQRVPLPKATALIAGVGKLNRSIRSVMSQANPATMDVQKPLHR
jgi:hypothetical protein